VDAGMGAKLMDCCNRAICTCWICCHGHDHRRWLVEIACRI